MYILIDQWASWIGNEKDRLEDIEASSAVDPVWSELCSVKAETDIVMGKAKQRICGGYDYVGGYVGSTFSGCG